MRRLAALAVVLTSLAAGTALPAPAAADDGRRCSIEWRAPVDGAWESPASWSDSTSGLPRTPDASDHVCLDVRGDYTVAISTPVVAQTVAALFNPGLTLALLPDAGGTASLELTSTRFRDVELGDSRLTLGDDLRRSGTAVALAGVRARIVETHGDAGAVRRFDGPVDAEEQMVVDAPTVAHSRVSVHGIRTTPGGRLEVTGGFEGEFQDSVDVSGPVVNDGDVDVRDARVFLSSPSQTGHPVRLHGGVLNGLLEANEVEVHGTVELVGSATDFRSTIGFAGGDGTDDTLIIRAGTQEIGSRLSFLQQPTASGRGGTATVRTEPGAAVSFRDVVQSGAVEGAPVGTLRLEGDLTFSQDRIHQTRAGRGTVLEVLDESRSTDPGLVLGGRFTADPGGRLRLAAPVTELAAELVLQRGGIVEDTDGVPVTTALSTVAVGGALRVGDVVATGSALVNRGTVELLPGGRLEAPQGYRGEEGSRTLMSGGELVTPVARLQRARLEGTGTLLGDLEADNGVVSAGTVEPVAAGELRVTGAARLLNSTNLLTPVTGPDPSQYGRLLVGGRLDTDPQVNAVTTAAYAPREGHRHRVITTGTDSTLPLGATSHKEDYSLGGPPYAVQTTARTVDLVVGAPSSGPDEPQPQPAPPVEESPPVEGGAEGGSGTATATRAEGVLTPGGRLSTAGGRPDGGNALVTSLSVPDGGPVSLVEEPGGQTERGWTAVGDRVEVTAPPATASAPLRLVLRVDRSVLPAGENVGTMTAHVDGVPVTAVCAGDALAEPAPCLASRGQDDGMAVLTVLTTGSGTWSTAVPERGSLAVACPAGSPSRSYGDVPASSAHAPAIGCLGARGVVRGTGDDAYSPERPVDRAQTASLVLKVLGDSIDRSAPVPDAFTDDEGSVHEEAINVLASVGVVRGTSATTYGPTLLVRRDQMASLLDRAYSYAGSFDGGRVDLFADDDGNLHEPSIDRLAAMGIAGGTTSSTFTPDTSVRRDQIASFAARLLSRLQAEGGLPRT